MKNYKFKFTVIVSIYNVEKYLAQTLDSVLCQSIGFKDSIELILVNDDSPDNCDEICREYQSRYPDNIKYLIKKNGGLSSARNYGFEHIRGKYVNFLDADDKWEKDAFEKAFAFFEEHFDEIDVLASRVRFFDAKDNWHPLDFKYLKGSRVIDVTDEKNCVHVHATSAFIKSSSIKNMRFNENIRFGEDGLFMNTLIMDRLKYGVVDDCVYYYRKRSDKSSLTQLQTVNREYYSKSPQLYYMGLAEESINRFGCVIPYIQNVLAYDIGWRMGALVPDEIRNDSAFFGLYLEFLNNILGYIDDEFFLRSPVHKRIAVKSAFYKLKHPDKELIGLTRFNLKKKSVYVGDVRLYNFNKANHSACIITRCDVSSDSLKVEGLVSRWLLSSCTSAGLTLAIKVNDEVYRVETTECTTKKEATIFGEVYPYYSFVKTVSFDVNTPLNLKIALCTNEGICEITAKFENSVDEKLFM